jgi:regulatory protein
MPAASPPQRIKSPRTLKQRAVALLARREYSRAELSKRLVRTAASSGEIDAVLDELAASGLLSDARFAAALVHQKTGSHSKRAIAHALREKGVGVDEAKAALVALEGDDELVAAQALWARRFGEPPRDEREKARQLRFLLSRGYSHSIAFKVLRVAGAAIEDEPS